MTSASSRRARSNADGRLPRGRRAGQVDRAMESLGEPPTTPVVHRLQRARKLFQNSADCTVYKVTCRAIIVLPEAKLRRCGMQGGPSRRIESHRGADMSSLHAQYPRLHDELASSSTQAPPSQPRDGAAQPVHQRDCLPGFASPRRQGDNHQGIPAQEVRRNGVRRCLQFPGDDLRLPRLHIQSRGHRSRGMQAHQGAWWPAACWKRTGKSQSSDGPAPSRGRAPAESKTEARTPHSPDPDRLPREAPPNGQPTTFLEIVEHEALGYRAWGSSVGISSPINSGGSPSSSAGREPAIPRNTRIGWRPTIASSAIAATTGDTTKGSKPGGARAGASDSQGFHLGVVFANT